MKKLLLAFAVTFALCASGSLARAGGDAPAPSYNDDRGYERPAPREPATSGRRVIVTKTYLPLLPPLPFFPPPPSIQVGETRTVVYDGGPRHYRRFRPYAYRRGYYDGPGYYGGPGVRVGVGF